jgi:hypothetical protein
MSSGRAQRAYDMATDLLEQLQLHYHPAAPFPGSMVETQQRKIHPSLDDLLHEMEDISRPKNTIMIVIDGWEEHRMQSSIAEFNRILDKMVSLSWKILVMSRRGPSEELAEKSSTLQIKAEDNEQAVKAFVQAGIEKNPNAPAYSLLEDATALKQQTVEYVVDKSQGLYVNCHIISPAPFQYLPNSY